MAALALTTGIAGAHVVDHALARRRGRATDKRVGRRCNGSGGGGRDRVRRGGARYGGPVSPEVSPDELEHLDLRSTRSTPGSLTLQMVAIPRPRLCPRAAGCLVATPCCGPKPPFVSSVPWRLDAGGTANVARGDPHGSLPPIQPSRRSSYGASIWVRRAAAIGMGCGGR